MKILKNISLTLLAALTLWGCESREQTVYDQKNTQPAQFTAYPTASISLDKDQPSAAQAVFAWKQASYGYNAAVKYTLQAFVEGGDKVVELGQTNGTSLSIQNKLLCSSLIALGAEPQSPFTFRVQLLSSIGVAISDTISLPIDMVVVPFSLEPTPLWVIGAYCGWSHDKAIKIYSENSNGLYKGWAYMNEDGKAVDALTEFAFTPAASWDKKWAGTMDALIKDGGDNIKIPNGYCNFFDVDTKALVAKIPKQFKKVGLVGGATPGGWDADTFFEYDAAKILFVAKDVEMKTGEGFKIRCDSQWTIQWGKADGLKDGFLPFDGGGSDLSFTLPSGKYDVELNLFTLTPSYKFIAK